jgi:hypothetical protein
MQAGLRQAAAQRSQHARFARAGLAYEQDLHSVPESFVQVIEERCVRGFAATAGTVCSRGGTRPTLQPRCALRARLRYEVTHSR